MFPIQNFFFPEFCFPFVPYTPKFYNDLILFFASSLLAQEAMADSEDAVNDTNINDSDPLDVKSLAANYDNLINTINKETDILAAQVSRHVYERKQISDTEIYKISERLIQMDNLLSRCNDINDNIDKLDQLHVFTIDFNTRLNSLISQLKTK